MYPNLYYAIKDLFGISNPWRIFHFINSFGFFVALSFVAAAVTLTRELMRKERQGLLQYREQLVTIGKPATPTELTLNFILGFILGFKLVGLFMADTALTANVQDYLVSAQGNLPAGIVAGLLLAGLKWYEKNKQKLPQPQEKKVRIWPHDRVGDLTIYAFIFGFIGAKIFNSLETWSDFVRDPIGSLFSFSGLTFYGGLICAALAIWNYARKNGIGFWHLNDAAAPGLMLAYAVGRIGCQVAGDGDWGLPNSAYVTNPAGKAMPAGPDDYMRTLHEFQPFYLDELHIKSIEHAPHLAVRAPSWLPDWLFAYPYPHNVINAGAHIANCNDQYCSVLPVPVFPTPFYELVVCLGLFFLLWGLRKRLKVPGTLFAVYLIANGIERFFIEKIRVNTEYDIFGLRPTQAELISAGLVIAGIWIYVALTRRRRPPAATLADSPGSGGPTV